MDDERRAATRLGVHLRATLRSLSGETVEGPLKDVSLGGVSIGTDAGGMHAGQDVRIAIALGSSSDLEISLNASVVRVSDGEIAVHFTEALNPESYAHLRNLLLLNSPDSVDMEEELRRHTGLSSE